MWRAYLAMTLLTDTEKAEKSAAIVGHAFQMRDTMIHREGSF
jgi:hypothetical protein